MILDGNDSRMVVILDVNDSRMVMILDDNLSGGSLFCLCICLSSTIKAFAGPVC